MAVKKIMENEQQYKLLFTEELDSILAHFGNDNERDTKIIEGMNQKNIKLLIKEVMDFWTNYPYHPVSIVPIKMAQDLVEISNGNQLTRIFKELDILLPVKERKKSKEHLFKRILHQYHLSKVQKNAINTLSLLLHEEINSCTKITEYSDDEIKDKAIKQKNDVVVEKMVEKSGILTALWIAREVVQNEMLEKLIIASNKSFYVMALAQAASYAKEIELEKIMVKPQTQVFKSTDVELVDARKEIKRLNKRIQKESINYSNLQKEFFGMKRENKRLSSEIREIYRMNEQDKQKHLVEVESMQTYYLHVIEQLIADLEMVNTVEETDEQFEMDLKGLKIAVIGGSRERHFRELIEKNNGEMLFVAEDDFNKIDGAVHKADVVFYLKEVVGHHFFREAYPLSKKYAVPFIYINTLGISTFKRELGKLVS